MPDAAAQGDSHGSGMEDSLGEGLCNGFWQKAHQGGIIKAPQTRYNRQPVQKGQVSGEDECQPQTENDMKGVYIELPGDGNLQKASFCRPQARLLHLLIYYLSGG